MNPIAALFQRKPQVETEKIVTQVLDRMVSQGRFLRDLEGYNPDELTRQKRIEIFDKMYRDDAVKAALSLKMAAPYSGGWSVVPASDDRRHQQQAEFIRFNFERLHGTVESVFRDTLTAMKYGFSVQEMVLETQPDGPWRAKWVLDRIVAHAPHNIQWVIQNDIVVGIRQNTAAEVVPTYKALIYTWEGEFGNPWGQSDLVAAYRPWFSKDFAIRHWNIWLERYALKHLVVKYDDTAQKALADEIVDKWAETVGMSFQTGTDVEIMGDNGRLSDVYSKTVEVHNQAISRSILKQTQATGDTGETGSYAKARVHRDILLMDLEKARQDIMETVIGEQMIRLLIDLNFPNVDLYPRLQLGELLPSDPMDAIEKFTDLLKDGGLIVTKADEDHIRKALEFPEREGDDAPPGPQSSPALFSVREALEASPEWQHRHELRAMNATEKKLNFQRIESRFDTLEEAAREQMVEVVEKMRDKMLSGIGSKFFKDGLANAREVNKIHVPFLREIRAVLEGQGTALFNSGIGDVRERVKAAMESGQMHDGAIRFAAANPGGLTYKQQIAAFKARWAARTEAVATEFGQEVERGTRNVLLRALENGETQRETEQKLIRVFEKYLPGTTKPGGAVEPWRLENIIRTNLTGAYAQGRLTASRDPDLEGFITGYGYSAVLDERTSDICESLDGIRLAANDPMVDRIVPPNHFQCRGVMFEIVQGEGLDLTSERGVASAVSGIQEGFR